MPSPISSSCLPRRLRRPDQQPEGDPPQGRDVQAVRPAGRGQVPRRGEQRQENQREQRVRDDQQPQALAPAGVGQPAPDRDQDLDRRRQLVPGLGSRAEPHGDTDCAASPRWRTGLPGPRAGLVAAAHPRPSPPGGTARPGWRGPQAARACAGSAGSVGPGGRPPWNPPLASGRVPSSRGLGPTEVAEPGDAASPAAWDGSSRTTGPCGEASDSSTGSATSSLVTAPPRRKVPARPSPSNTHPSGPQASSACCLDTVGSLTTTSLSALRPILMVRPRSKLWRWPSQLT